MSDKILTIEQIDKKIKYYENKLSKLEKNDNLKGVLVYKYIKCGKENCTCATGQKHGPYLHFQTYDKNEHRIKTKYIRKNDTEFFEEKYKENKDYVKTTKKLEELYKLRKKLKKGSKEVK